MTIRVVWHVTPCTFVHETARFSLKVGNRGVTGGGGGYDGRQSPKCGKIGDKMNILDEFFYLLLSNNFFLFFAVENFKLFHPKNKAQ
jgi:hypothetical protein